MAQRKKESGDTMHRYGSGHLLDSMVGCSDMVLLDPITMDNLVENLRKRYEAGEIYTYIGSVVISVNPYRPLPIYSDSQINEYRSRNIYELPPHLYAIADDSYRSMRDWRQNQCIIISGESGAGKTEASKHIMQYVAQVSGKGREVDRVKEQLLQSIPVLEAFGNAKTNSNDNSSRFGKYMDMEFDFKGDPLGGVISSYLLEKSRVVQQSPGERNFHIFFQLLAGAPPDVLRMLHLDSNVFMYNYLSSTGSTFAVTKNDKEEFDVTMQAMNIIGFDADEIVAILELLASILILGNITFEGYSLPDGTNACKIKNKEMMRYVCDMLGCSVELMEQCLTKRSVETSMDMVLTSLSDTKAYYARDALSKAIYDRLFSWVVQRINDSIQVKKKTKSCSMGVLDIYGFEVFETNSFEQFMINYCNERLQQLFIDLTLGAEQQEYIREAIQWELVEYFDNTPIVELIEDSTEGILALMDEECLRPGQTSDKTLIDKFNQEFAEHSYYISRESHDHFSDQSLTREQFRLVHYAGDVTYDIKGFMDKNKDLLFKDLSQAMFASDQALLQTLFPEGDPEAVHLKRPTTTGKQFKASVSELMTNLLAKNPNYVRCIKPNDEKRPRQFEVSLVKTQVRYLNLVENIRVRRAGYAYRQDYKLALERYKMLSPRTWPIWKRSPKDGVKYIMQACGKTTSDFSLGRTKVFIRSPKTVFEMEDKRKRRMHDLARLLQATYRGWSAWKKYQKLRWAEITVARYYRGHVCRKAFLIKKNAAIVVQKYFRGWQVREALRKQRYLEACIWASGIIRKYYYGWKARKEYRRLLYIKRFTPATVVIQKYYRGWRVRNRINKMWGAVIIQKYVRGWLVRKKMRGMKAEEAGPIITKFIKQALRYRFLITLYYNLPSRSPLDKKWPRCSKMFRRTSILLRNMYHAWRCRVVRNEYTSNPARRQMMIEKSRASALFKDRKALYSRSISDPFEQDRIGLQADERWARIFPHQMEQKIVWADHVQKLSRADAKLSQRVLGVTVTSICVLDSKYTLQNRVQLSELEGISLSPHSDGFVVFHLKHSSSKDKYRPKGDLVFLSPRAVEMVTKLSMVVKETQKRQIRVSFSEQIIVQFKAGESTALHFIVSRGGYLSSPSCRRKGSTINILVS